jgi:hypothetical protein
MAGGATGLLGCRNIPFGKTCWLPSFAPPCHRSPTGRSRSLRFFSLWQRSSQALHSWDFFFAHCRSLPFWPLPFLEPFPPWLAVALLPPSASPAILPAIIAESRVFVPFDGLLPLSPSTTAVSSWRCIRGNLPRPLPIRSISAASPSLPLTSFSPPTMMLPTGGATVDFFPSLPVLWRVSARHSPAAL